MPVPWRPAAHVEAVYVLAATDRARGASRAHGDAAGRVAVAHVGPDAADRLDRRHLRLRAVVAAVPIAVREISVVPAHVPRGLRPAVGRLHLEPVLAVEAPG